MLPPPDLRDWVPEDHLVHFILEAVGLMGLRTARVNQRGTGSEQYSPGMMPGLLIYCYATGTFSSRRIERLTHENVAVRYLCADRHPDHDSICTFRRENRALLESSFEQVLEVAARVRAVTLALDGTRILASASRHSAVSHGHALKQMVLLEEQNRRTARRGGRRGQRAAGGRADGAGRTERSKIACRRQPEGQRRRVLTNRTPARAPRKAARSHVFPHAEAQGCRRGLGRRSWV